MSIGLVSVPFLSMINFSITWGMGLKGAKSMNTAIPIRIMYGILSRKAIVRLHPYRLGELASAFLTTSATVSAVMPLFLQ